MQANWSLMLNILLLLGVLVAIMHLMKTRKLHLNREYSSSLAEATSTHTAPPTYADDIIAVRKIPGEFAPEPEDLTPFIKTPTVKSAAPRLINENLETTTPAQKTPSKAHNVSNSTIMLFLSAKENRQFAGYELLQTVLAAGLRFGEGHLFHRHQFANGQGPVLCSLAAATESGVFDLENIGAFSVKGLCLFMHRSQNPGIDEERFLILLDTARQLSEGLDAQLLDFQKRPLTDDRITNYYNLLNIAS